MTRRAEVELSEGSQAAGNDNALLNSVYNDIGYDFLRAPGVSDTISRGAADLGGVSYLDCSIPIIGYEPSCASAGSAMVRVRTEAARIRIEAPATPAVITDKPVAITGPKGDVGLRYTARSASGIGTVDTDHMGMVRALSFEDKDGKRISIGGERLARIMSDSAFRETALGWRIDRAGTGAGRTTFVTAPDGRTTFLLDHKGRLMGEVGTHEVASPPSVVRTATPEGVRYETPGFAGETRTAMTDNSGALRRITVRSAAGETIYELKPESWAGLSSNHPLNLGHGWTAERGHFGDKFHFDSIRISHTDGTTYMVSATGNNLSYANNPVDYGPRTARRSP